MNSLYALFAARASACPLSPVLRSSGDRVLTYSELARQVTCLAHRISSAANIEHGSCAIGILIDNPTAMIAGVLGALQAGCSVVPIDPLTPLSRIAGMLEISGATALLTDRHDLAVDNDCFTRPITLVAFDTENCSDAGGQEFVDGRSSTIVLFTSGTTGKPKGIALSPAALATYCKNFAEVIGLRSDDVVLQQGSPGFDLYFEELFATFAAGACLACIDRFSINDAAKLEMFLRQHKVSVVDASPHAVSLINGFAELPPSLRVCVAGGDRLRPQHIANLLRANVAVFNTYGPTETTICATYHRCSLADLDGKIPIGKPFPGYRCYVFDETGAIAARDSEGELYIAGFGVAHGYLGDPVATASRFIPDPNDVGQRMYATGDRVAVAADGAILFVGRVDHQVKIRGFRVEPGEVAAALISHSGVEDAHVTTTRQDAHGNPSLFAYIVPKNPAEPPAKGDLAQYLRGKLPYYAIPTGMAFIAEIPRNRRGKLDALALPVADEMIEAPADTEGTSFASDLERELAAQWSAVLQRSEIRRDDDFIQLGGTSLLIGQLINRIRARFGCEFEFRDAFAHPTLASMAAHLSSRARLDQSREVSALPRINQSEPFPLSYHQERIWFLCTYYPDNISYNFSATMDLVGFVDPDIVRLALRAVLKKHEAFRTVIALVGDHAEPMQTVQEDCEAPFAVVNLRSLSAEDAATTLAEGIRQRITQPFALVGSYLARWTLFQLPGQRSVLLHVEHHLIHDGWSYNVFLRDFAAAYRALYHGAEPGLIPAVMSYGDFAVWQRQWIRSTEAVAQLAYWKDKLAGYTGAIDLPMTDSDTASLAGMTLKVEIPGSLCEAARSFCRASGVTLYAYMMTVFKHVMLYHSGQRDLGVGVGIAARTRSEYEDVVGMFVNNLVIRTSDFGRGTLAASVLEERSVLEQAYKHQDYPFDLLVRELQPVRRKNRNPLIPILFSFHDAPMCAFTLPGVRPPFLTVGLTNNSAKFDMNVVAIPHKEQQVAGEAVVDTITLEWEFNTARYDEHLVRRMLDDYLVAFEQIAAQPELSSEQLQAHFFRENASDTFVASTHETANFNF